MLWSATTTLPAEIPSDKSLHDDVLNLRKADPITLQDTFKVLSDIEAGLQHANKALQDERDIRCRLKESIRALERTITSTRALAAERVANADLLKTRAALERKLAAAYKELGRREPPVKAKAEWSDLQVVLTVFIGAAVLIVGLPVLVTFILLPSAGEAGSGSEIPPCSAAAARPTRCVAQRQHCMY
jgi:hypothetical protein